MGDLQSSAERYVKDAFQWLVPFLHRCEGQTAGAAVALLREYLVGLAQQDLTLALVVFRQSKPDVRGNDADARTHARTHNWARVQCAHALTNGHAHTHEYTYTHANAQKETHTKIDTETETRIHAHTDTEKDTQ